MIKDVTMDKDIRDFLDKATQKRLCEEKRKRKDKRLAKQANLQERKNRRNAAQNGVDLLCGERIKGDNMHNPPHTRSVSGGASRHQ